MTTDTAGNGQTRLAGFIEANTKLLAPPLVPEITLHLSEEALPIWRKTEEELGEMNIPPPFWAFAWAGGQAMARYIFDNPETVAGRRVLDLGSGAALAAIAAMKSGARRALAADIDPFAAAAANLNAKANDVTFDTTTADLLEPGVGHNSFDVVLVADVFFERELAERIMVFAERQRQAGARVLIGDPNRSYFPADKVAKLVQYDVPVTQELEDAEIKRAAVWEYLGCMSG